ncbi:unnamed protein product, partial [Cyprideis torosa]
MALPTASRCFLLRTNSSVVAVGPRTMATLQVITRKIPYHGKREIVGFGVNGQPAYMDRLDQPFPAIRFKELTPELAVTL